MKKKIIFGITICLFIMATMFSFNMSEQSNISDISLKNIAALSTANAEDNLVGCDRYYHGPWCGAVYTQNGYDVYYSYAYYF